MAGRRFPWLGLVLATVLVAVSAVLAYRGWSFYQLSLEDRPEHPDFQQLRPSGMYGNGYGWVAALLVILNLGYLVRRRLASTRLGSMRAWLDVHVFTGLLASVLVSFHSAFQLRTPIATVSAASLAVVVVTGLIGRFLYALAPAADRKRLRDALDGMEAVFPGHRDEFTATLDALPGPTVPANASIFRSLIAIPAWLHVSAARRHALAILLPAMPTRAMKRAFRELARAAAMEARASGIAALLRSWRGLHRLFALAMLATVLFHAYIAWRLGYRWIFT